MVNKPNNSSRREALKTLFKSIGALGPGGWSRTDEESLENVKDPTAGESPPEDILNDWEHLLGDD